MHIVQRLTKERQSDSEIWSVCKMSHLEIFLEKLHTKRGGETSPRPFSKTSELNSLCINSLNIYAVYFYSLSELRTTKIH